jgi:glycosyltransferase involved in cell wall biosynthesis
MGPDNEKSRFIISCANILSEEQGVEWLFLVDGAYPADWLSGSSGHRLLTKRTFPGKGGWKIWYDWQIPLTVKKYRPDLVMTTGGVTAAARMQVPQCVWMTAGAGKRPEKKKVTTVYSKRLAATLQSAQVVFSFSEKDKAALIGYAADGRVAGKILVVPPVADKFLPLPSGEKEQLKERYAEGKEYFLTAVSGAADKEVVDLLKAFSLFKKRQRSNMQLVLAGGNPALDRDLAGRLATYKYRQDIHWTRHPSEQEWGRLATASYAIVAPFERDSLGIHILNAWKAGVPVITTTTDSACLPDIAGAVLYAQPGDPASLAGQLMLIYKDESLRNSLIAEGTKHGQSFSWDRSAGEVWAGIMAINT